MTTEGLTDLAVIGMLIGIGIINRCNKLSLSCIPLIIRFVFGFVDHRDMLSQSL